MAEQPVFVDNSGRRRRLGRRIGYFLVGGIGLYLLLIVIGMLGGPEAPRRAGRRRAAGAPPPHHAPSRRGGGPGERRSAPGRRAGRCGPPQPVAPAVRAAGPDRLAFLDPVRVVGVWLAFVAVQALAGGYAMRLDRERLGPLWSLPLQQFVYRQLMYLVVIQSVVTALLGTRLRWHTIRRTGTFGNGAASPRPTTPDRA